MERGRPRWVVPVIASAIVLAVSLALGYLAFEVYVRYQLIVEYRREAHQLVIYSEPVVPGPWETGQTPSKVGVNKENRDVHLWLLSPEIKTLLRVRFHLNNYGFYSSKTYSLARGGREFRIVVLGDSMTGTTTMPYQWVDRLEDLLNEDQGLLRALDVDAVRVYNIGVPGAGFMAFNRLFVAHGRQFDPDLVVVNYIESDFPRIERARTVSGESLLAGYVPYAMGPREEDLARLEVHCTSAPVSLNNPECYHFFLLYAQPSLVEDRARMKALYSRIVDETVRGKGFFTLYPYGWHRLRGRSQPLSAYRRPEIYHIVGPRDDEMVEQARVHLGKILGAHRNVLVTLMPIYNDFVKDSRGAYPEYTLTRKLLARDPALRVRVMRDVMVPLTGNEDPYGWYNLPYDGHMNARGGEIYTRLMANAVKHHLRDTGLVHRTVREEIVPPLRLAAGQVEMSVRATPAAADARPQRDASACRNLLVNGDFTEWEGPPRVEVATAPATGPAGWTLLADGTAGAGKAVVTREMLRAVGAVPFLRFQQLRSATAGTPSLAQDVPGVAALAERTATLSFYARAAAPTKAVVMLVQNFGTGERRTWLARLGLGPRPSPGVVAAVDHFVVDTDWRRFTFVHDLPSVKGKKLGTAGNDALKLVLGPADARATFTIDVTNVQLEEGRAPKPFARRDPASGCS